MCSVWILQKLFGTCLFFIWNKTKFVLSLLIDNLLAKHQSYNLRKSYFAWFIASCNYLSFPNINGKPPHNESNSIGMNGHLVIGVRRYHSCHLLSFYRLLFYQFYGWRILTCVKLWSLAVILQTIFSNAFSECKYLHFNSNSIDICS